jgi:hypothetical protein
MEIFNFKENCKSLKSKLTQKHANIQKADLQCSDGRKKEMLEKLQQKLGKTSQELREIIIKL